MQLSLQSKKQPSKKQARSRNIRAILNNKSSWCNGVHLSRKRNALKLSILLITIYNMLMFVSTCSGENWQTLHNTERSKIINMVISSSSHLWHTAIFYSHKTLYPRCSFPPGRMRPPDAPLFHTTAWLQVCWAWAGTGTRQHGTGMTGAQAANNPFCIYPVLQFPLPAIPSVCVLAQMHMPKQSCRA